MASEQQNPEVPQAPAAGTVERQEVAGLQLETVSGNPEDVSRETQEQATEMIRAARAKLETVARRAG